jgi:hypothetical protein
MRLLLGFTQAAAKRIRGRLVVFLFLFLPLGLLVHLYLPSNLEGGAGKLAFGWDTLIAFVLAVGLLLVFPAQSK